MSTEPAENPIVVNLSPTYGALLIGTAFACAIWGVTSTQAFIYFSSKSAQKDSRVMRYFMLLLVIMDTVNTGLCFTAVWDILIPQYGAIAPLSRITVVLLHRIWITIVITVCVQCFFLRRVFVYSGNRGAWPYFLALLCILIIWQIAAVIIYLAIAFTASSLATLSRPFMIDVGISLRGATTVVDTSISLSMFYLLTLETQPVFSRTRQMVNRLTKVAVMSGVFTTVFSIFVVSFMAARPSDLFYTIFETPLTSLYVSVLLSNLNARHYVRGTSDINWTSQVEFSSSGGQTVRLNTLNPPTSRALTWGNRNLKATKEHAIQIHTKSETQTDGPSGSSVDVDAGSCSVKNMPESV